ncbi:MAG: peptidoglycan bridge formation glycyltransferase FemA/FemB family protein [Candidatus Doudnabacteria bacterium]|nr:peptidoglycan bridge formation glycyltransferase FemA/FemB family protein [Candidatus Doudnabacteria bacterium]
MLSNFSKQEWDKKVIELNGSILQSWDWGEFQNAHGLKVHRLMDSEFAAQVLETPLISSKKYLYVPRGPLGNLDLAMADLKALATKDRDVVFARIEPSVAVNLPKAAKETQPTHNWLVDLEPSEPEILTSMKPKTRYNINLASRKGVVIGEGGAGDLIDVYKLLLETAGRNNFRLHPQNYYVQMRENLSRDNLRILIAEYAGKPLATMFLTMFGTTATYLHGGSSQAMKDVMAPYLLHWEAMKLAKKMGYKYYDLGGIAPNDANPEHAWSGISRFKKSFGGFELVYPGSFEMIFSPLWYNVYTNARKLRNIIRK